MEFCPLKLQDIFQIKKPLKFSYEEKLSGLGTRSKVQTALPTLAPNLFMSHIHMERDCDTNGGMCLPKHKRSKKCIKGVEASGTGCPTVDSDVPPALPAERDSLEAAVVLLPGGVSGTLSATECHFTEYTPFSM